MNNLSYRNIKFTDHKKVLKSLDLWNLIILFVII